MPPRRRGERRDERLSSIGLGAGRSARKSHILFCRVVWARGSQKKMLTRGRRVRMRRKKRRSSGSGIPEAGGMRIRPLPGLSAAHHSYVFGALRGVPAEVGRGKTPGLRLLRWGEGFLPETVISVYMALRAGMEPSVKIPHRNPSHYNVFAILGCWNRALLLIGRFDTLTCLEVLFTCSMLPMTRR
jgi:hypothetical protein